MSSSSTVPTRAPAATRGRSRALPTAVGAVVVAAIAVVAGLYFLHVGPFASGSTGSPAASYKAGGFTQGAVVTFVYNSTYTCTPGLLTFYPSATAAASATPCEIGQANQNALNQVPEWILVPAFAGMSIFGIVALGASPHGFAKFQGSTLLTDCGGGESTTACSDHPTDLYAPLFASIEQAVGITTSYGGRPEGVLPMPAHDALINTSATFPNVEWGSIVVLVLDPNVFPDRATGACTAQVASNLSSATGHCLVSLSALERALVTSSSSVATANAGNPVWGVLGSPSTQVVVPGDLTVGQVDSQLDANLYIPFAVQPGAPSSFPA